jgi:TRAP-type mannitol/chloroaromatic compound transport system substrate-binding protein
MYDEIAAENPRFKKVYEGWSAFRGDVVNWFRINETPFDTIVAQRVAQGRR